MSTTAKCRHGLVWCVYTHIYGNRRGDVNAHETRREAYTALSDIFRIVMDIDFSSH